MGAVHDVGPKTWSAAGRDDAFDYWREVVCQAYTRLSPERLQDGPFAGVIRLTRFGDGGSLSCIEASPQRVARRREDVAARPCEAVFVNIQLTGASVVRQRGIETRLPAGSLALLDARQPFEMRFDGPFRQACLHVPMASVALQSFDPARVIARRVGCGTVFGAAFMGDVGAALDEIDGEDAAEHLLARLWLYYEGGGADTLADQHLALIRDFISDNCTDVALSPQAVAAHFRISVRYVHKLFARSGVSFGRYLLHCRLDRALSALNRQPDRPILDVAREVGFRSASHFTRSFRGRYGNAPSAVRRLHRPEPDA